MAMVNQVLNLNNTANVKDSRWLTLEVCREYQRNKCTRSDTECKFAHPPPHVEVQNGRVTACFDSIKGKCQRKDPPCKYLHPPQHLREQLLQNGRNNLILRNLHIQAVQALNQPLVPGMIPTLASPTNKGTASTIPAIYPAGQLPILIPDRAYGWSGGTYGTASTILDASNIPDRVYGWSGGIYGNPHPYLAASVPPTSVAYNPYSMQTVAVPNHVSDSSVVSQQIPSVIPAISSAATQQKLARADRLEVCREFQRGTCTRQPSECRYAHPPDNVTVDCSENQVTVCMDFIKGKCTRDSCKYFHPPPHLQAQIKAAQQRANTTAAQAQALPQVVEVIQGKKRPRDHADDIVLQSAMPGMIPFKRVAVPDKNGIPVYQPGANLGPYQQAIAAMHLQQQQFIPTLTYKNGPQTAVCPSGSPSPAMTIQQQYVPVTMPLVISPAATPEALVAAPASVIPTNAHNVNYFDNNQQLLDTLPVCQDFKMGRCNRPACNKVHILQDYVEVTDGRVAVCRDAVRGKCTRPLCKYYHIPIPLPPSK